MEADSDIELSRFRRESGPVKRYSVKCLNDCLTHDDDGTKSYLACLETCDDEDEDGDEDENVTDGGDNVDVDVDDDDDVDGDDGDVVYY